MQLARRALEASPDDPEIWNTLGVAHYRAGSWESSEEALRRAIEIKGESSAFDLLYLAMAQKRLGRHEDALASYERAGRAPQEYGQPRAEERRRVREEAAELLGLAESND